MESPEIAARVRQILLDGVLRGTNPTLLQDATPLLSGGVIDSMRMVTLISELERAFGVSFEAFEMSVDYLDSIAVIARTIRAKQAS